MTIETVIQVIEQGIMTVLYIVGPPLATAMAVGLFVAILQAATQIQETSLTFVPKVAAVGLTLVLTARWNINHLTAFVRELMQRMEGMSP
ncbi:MAG: flagellar biosynthesis protein FliQ [Deltaproteobacteria bacterium]|nr:flagellar biosynthesis protein FliQ [Deltaproteobacteria bacterium]